MKQNAQIDIAELGASQAIISDPIFYERKFALAAAEQYAIAILGKTGPA
jgi:hypothetical protein